MTLDITAKCRQLLEKIVTAKNSQVLKVQEKWNPGKIDLALPRMELLVGSGWGWFELVHKVCEQKNKSQRTITVRGLVKDVLMFKSVKGEIRLFKSGSIEC